MNLSRLSLALFVAAMLAGCGSSTPESTSVNAGMCKTPPAPAATCVRGRTVVLVRHAEKGTDEQNPKDPPLSEPGKARAKRIASMLATAGVTKIFSTPYKRTQETVTPLSQKTGVAIEAMAPEKMRDAIKAAPDGAVIVIATHSNLVPPLVKDLADTTLRGVEGDPSKAMLAEDDFSRVVVIAQPCDSKNGRVTELSSASE